MLSAFATKGPASLRRIVDACTRTRNHCHFDQQLKPGAKAKFIVGEQFVWAVAARAGKLP
jgi:hypothetical protein